MTATVIIHSDGLYADRVTDVYTEEPLKDGRKHVRRYVLTSGSEITLRVGYNESLTVQEYGTIFVPAQPKSAPSLSLSLSPSESDPTG
jgi:hypothetical protein